MLTRDRHTNPQNTSAQGPAQRLVSDPMPSAEQIRRLEQQHPELHSPSPHPDLLCSDTYLDAKAAGKTIGSRSTSGAIRRGCDLEKQVAIDNGALRFQPLLTPGWGRQGIAYGPYPRQNGLAFAVLLSNGHNTSQAEPIEPLKFRLQRWWLGSETEPPMQRLQRWLRSPHKKGAIRRFWHWIRTAPDYATHFPVTRLDENLAVGWFSQEVPEDPNTDGNGLIVHATGANNGELLARVGTELMSAFRGLQNLQTYYVVILRQQGAAYYVASVPNAKGFAAYPHMRPIAIDPSHHDPEVYAGIYQSVLGQIGFRVDTRVYSSQVAQLPTLDTWYGTAHMADSLCGQGAIDQSSAEVGGPWQSIRGQFQRTPKGIVATESDSVMVLTPEQASGLIHVLVETADRATSVGLMWRVADPDHYWLLQLDAKTCQLFLYTDGQPEVMATSHLWHLTPNTQHGLQIVDEGDCFRLYLDGQLLFNKAFTDAHLSEANGLGLMANHANSQQLLRAFEAHARSVPIPSALSLQHPWQAEGDRITIADDFSGPPKTIIDRLTPTGYQAWQRTIGRGHLVLTGDETARIQANSQHPNPGRTAWTVAWEHTDFADIEVEITPPGQRRYQLEKGRGGLIFWQDELNYITISNWLDDVYDGASISSFFYLNGYEELYDAVWTNVAHRVFWGKPHRLRTVFDGMNFMVFVNDEPVLYRALTDVYPQTPRLRINRVGLISNWEWGNDTGSVFKNFVAKAR